MATELPDDQIKAFLDASPDAMVIVDDGGRIVFVNIQTEAMFEYPRAELVGQPVELLLPERFRDRHASHVCSYSVAPRRRPMGAGLELYARRKDGTEFPVEISLSPVTTARGRFVSSAIRNVTDRKAIERQLIEARQSAERANQAKSAFLAAASHDLRQPLQTLSLLTSALGRVVPSDSKAATAVANQSEALRSMAELLNALLDISKLEAGVVKPDLTDCSVRQIFTRLRHEFAALAEAKGLELIVEDCHDVVRTDPVLLGQIIQNLVGNAIRYTRQGWVRLRCIASLHAVQIEVADTGIGIPAEELELVFDEYYQTSRKIGEARQGIGLGLSIARRVAALLGCSLDVTS
ncbi:MAG TPA: PAS domain-containing sensor histidine kinase, partial [Gammaproteobacteria bacterium]